MILVILLILLMMRNQTRSRWRSKRRRRDRNLQRMNLSESLSSPCQLLKNRLSQRDRLILRESNANKTKRKSLNKIRNLSQSLRRSPKMILRNKNFAQLVSNMLREICIMVMVKLLPADCQWVTTWEAESSIIASIATTHMVVGSNHALTILFAMAVAHAHLTAQRVMF